MESELSLIYFVAGDDEGHNKKLKDATQHFPDNSFAVAHEAYHLVSESKDGHHNVDLAQNFLDVWVLNAFEGERKKEENGDERVRALIIRNHGIVSIGNNIYQASAVIESLEEWANIYTIPKIFGGPKYVL